MITTRLRDSPLVIGVAATLVMLAGTITAVAQGSGPVTELRKAFGTQASVPFHDTAVVYGRHVLTPAQVRALTRAAGTAVAVSGFELDVASGDPRFPAVPVSAIVVDPKAYADVAATPSLDDQLKQGIVLSETSAKLRHTHQGARLLLANGTRLTISAVVDDHLLGGAELMATSRQLKAPAGASYLLVPTSVAAAALRKATPEIGLRVVAKPRNGYLSNADTVLTQQQMKVEFGEFATKTIDGSLQLDARWRTAWLASANIPQLGVVTCNRLVLPALRAAMQEITAKGLGAIVHTADFRRQGGCWSPRVVRLGGGRISSHAWGAAVDINVDANPLGERPHQDARLVAIMREHGFVWGGDFLRPDGAHFEWIGKD